MNALAKSFCLRASVLALAIAGLSSVAAAADRAPSAEQVAAQQQAAALAAVAANRSGTISALVSQWQPAATALGYPADAWAVEFAAILGGTSNEQLLAMQSASNYDAVRAILQGRSAPVSVSGLAGANDLGDTTNDLTYTPVTPCRILDTRNTSQPAGGTTRNFLVYGTGAQMAAQGGNAAGCASPKGEPAGIAANFTVVPTLAGHIRVFPFAAPLPTASFLNFQPGANLANAGIIATCYACASDLSIFNNVATHYLADVMGYFYPAQIGIAVETREGGYDWFGPGIYLITAAPPPFIGPVSGSTTFTLSGGEEVMMQFSAQAFGNAVGNACGTLHAAYRNTVTNVVTPMGGFDGETDFSFPSNGPLDQRSLQVSGRVSSMPAGTYEFGITAVKGSTGCGAAVDYSLTSTKTTVTKIRRP
jgi:hypothetical protein